MEAFWRRWTRSSGGILLLLFNLATFPGRAPAAEGSLADFATRFAHPPAESRIIKIIHNWPDKPEAQDVLIQRLQTQGFGGVVCNVSFDQYLDSNAKWEAFMRAVREAKRVGMALWLYDERGYPSGNAGGLVLREHPEWEARGWLVADTECDTGPVELNVPPGTLFLAAAFPLRDGQIDLAGKVDLAGDVHDGKLYWSAPEGRWHVMVFTESRLYEGTHADGNLFAKMPYVNLLMPEPTQRFITLTHQRYAERLGNDLGRNFVATFTDEPSLMSCYLKPMPWRPLPWAPNLPVQFQQRRGYPLDASVVPALVGNAGPRGARIRYDFWHTVGELVSSNYFGQIQERCRTWNIPSGGHLLMEEGLVAHVPLYGDFFRCARRLDAPSIDCLTSVPSEVPWYIARLLASAGELEGRRIVMSETSDHAQVWRPPGDKRPKRVVSEAQIRGTCNRLIVSGVNAITSYYSFTDLDDDSLRRLNEWIGRCCASLTGGHQVADVALLYPVESIWPKFRPARHWANDSPGATAIENTWRAAAEGLFAGQRDFTIIDSRTLTEAKVDAGALVHGQLRWRAVVLPGVDTLPGAAWENLDRFVRSGGVVIALRALPMNSETEFPSSKIQSLGRKMFGAARAEPSMTTQGKGGAGVFLPAGSEGLLPIVLDGVLERDVTVYGPRSPVRATHRRIDGREVYFLINDSSKPWQGEVSVSARRWGERWDPAIGTVAQADLAQRLKLNLEPYGATLLRCPAARLPQRRAPRGDVLPNLVQRALPDVKPAMVQGEFVRAEVLSDPVHSQPRRPAWRASARLTKSQVDTFMFVRFLFPEPLDLTGTECLVVDAWVPDGQQTGTQLLAIVQEKDGGDFLSDTGCLLGAPGHHRVFVPISRLQLAGWSQDSDGELDLKRVSEVRIGWGGYLGTEGERVEFSLALPQTGSIAIAGQPPQELPRRLLGSAAAPAAAGTPARFDNVPPTGGRLPPDDGYRGIWYCNQATRDEYKYKYSGGFATYPQQHAPIAIYCKEVDKTFFVYGGTTARGARDKQELLHMVSYYDHRTGQVPRPRILLNKRTDDAHDNPTLQVDDQGYLWVFSSSHGTGRPSYIHRSVKPWSIDEFERVLVTNFSYPQPWHVPGQGFLFLHTRYGGGKSSGIDAARCLFWMTSADGAKWDEPRMLAGIEQGDYQVSWRAGPRVATAFDFHPRPTGLNARANIYYLETGDLGRTWRNACGEPQTLPLTDTHNPALAYDSRADGRLVYLKDVNFDRNGRPVILFLTSKGFEPGPQNGPRQWQTLRWTGQEWVRRPFTTSGNNYDHGSLYLEPDGTWRVIAPTDRGPQPYNPGGEMVMWTSTDEGRTWTRIKQLTRNSPRNHTYARRPLHAHPDFYALWADGHGREPSESSLYFTNQHGDRVWRLPTKMDGDFASPVRVQ